MNPTLIWLAALAVALILTAAELLVRYGELGVPWFRSRWCLAFVAVNLLAVAFFLWVFNLSGAGAGEDGAFSAVLTFVLAESAGLAVLRAGTFANQRLETGKTTDEAMSALRAYEGSVGRTVTAVLSFFVRQSDQELQEKHDDMVAQAARRLKSQVTASDATILESLPGALRALPNFPTGKAARYDLIVQDMRGSKYNLDESQKAFVLVLRCVDLLGEERTRRGLDLLQ